MNENFSLSWQNIFPGVWLFSGQALTTLVRQWILHPEKLSHLDTIYTFSLSKTKLHFEFC